MESWLCSLSGVLEGVGKQRRSQAILFVTVLSWEDQLLCEVQVGTLQAFETWSGMACLDYTPSPFLSSILPNYSRCSSDVTPLAQVFSSTSPGRSHLSLLP